MRKSVYGAERMSVRGQGSLYVEDVRETDSGTYICRATNDEDSVDTVATLIVEGKQLSLLYMRCILR